MNNFEIIKDLLEFSPGDFFFCQILQRKKENNELGRNSRMIKSYYISSLEYLTKRLPEIEAICKATGARAYINLNRRSYKKVAFHTLGKISNQILNDEYPNVKAAYDHSCGKYSNEPNKKWIVDVDNVQFNKEYFLSTIHILNPLGHKLIAEIPTKNGYHLIVKPFDRSAIGKYQSEFPEIDLGQDIKTDNSTLLVWF